MLEEQINQTSDSKIPVNNQYSPNFLPVETWIDITIILVFDRSESLIVTQFMHAKLFFTLLTCIRLLTQMLFK